MPGESTAYPVTIDWSSETSRKPASPSSQRAEAEVRPHVELLRARDQPLRAVACRAVTLAHDILDRDSSRLRGTRFARDENRCAVYRHLDAAQGALLPPRRLFDESVGDRVAQLVRVTRKHVFGGVDHRLFLLVPRVPPSGGRTVSGRSRLCPGVSATPRTHGDSVRAAPEPGRPTHPSVRSTARRTRCFAYGSPRTRYWCRRWCGTLPFRSPAKIRRAPRWKRSEPRDAPLAAVEHGAVKCALEVPDTAADIDVDVHAVATLANHSRRFGAIEQLRRAQAPAAPRRGGRRTGTGVTTATGPALWKPRLCPEPWPGHFADQRPQNAAVSTPGTHALPDAAGRDHERPRMGSGGCGQCSTMERTVSNTRPSAVRQVPLP